MTTDVTREPTGGQELREAVARASREPDVTRDRLSAPETRSERPTHLSGQHSGCTGQPRRDHRTGGATVSDLAEFLIARIAEDEEEVGRESSLADYCDAREGIHLSARRALAECEAKRRIVELRQGAAGFVPLRRPGTVMPHELSQAAAASLPALDETLRLLALPYADHPDYRQEWAVQ